MMHVYLDGKPATMDQVIALAITQYGYRPKGRPSFNAAVFYIHSHPDRKQRISTVLVGD